MGFKRLGGSICSLPGNYRRVALYLLDAISNGSSEPVRSVLIFGTVCFSGRGGIVDLHALFPQIDM